MMIQTVKSLGHTFFGALWSPVEILCAVIDDPEDQCPESQADLARSPIKILGDVIDLEDQCQVSSRPGKAPL